MLPKSEAGNHGRIDVPEVQLPESRTRVNLRKVFLVEDGLDTARHASVQWRHYGPWSRTWTVFSAIAGLLQ
jgi:hypothetical protein